MKIALINNLYAQQKRGGAEIIVKKLKHALEKQGHDCFVISTAPKKATKNTNTYNNNNNYLISSLYYNLYKFPYIFRLLWHLYKQLECRSAIKVKRILKQEKPNLIISHNLTGFSIKIYKIINKLNIYHIHYLHDSQMLHPGGRIIYKKEDIVNSSFARLYQKIQKKYSAKADLIVSPSKWLLKLHQDKGFFKSTKTWQKFNPIENIKIESTKINSKFTFIYIGQIDINKGVELMIKSFIKISNNNTELKIIGDGQALKTLKQKYTKYKNIIFLGRLSYQESMQELSLADTLVLASLIYENSPTALFDALKLNKNIIASDLGGNSEILKSYYGQLFSPNSIDSLSAAMNNSLNKKERDKKPVDLSDLQAKVYIEELLEQLHLS